MLLRNTQKGELELYLQLIETNSEKGKHLVQIEKEMHKTCFKLNANVYMKWESGDPLFVWPVLLLHFQGYN